MKTLLLLLLTCLPLCAATTYPMLSDTTNRTVTGGVTNISFLNSNSVFTGTARWMGIVTLTNTGNIFVGDGSGLTGVGMVTSGGLATNATIYGLTVATGQTNTHLTASSIVTTDANKGIVSGTTTADLATLSANQTFTGTNTFPAASFYPANNIGMRLLWSSPTNIFLSSVVTNATSNATNAGNFSDTTYIAKATIPPLLGSNSSIAISYGILRTNANPVVGVMYVYAGAETNFVGNNITIMQSSAGHTTGVFVNCIYLANSKTNQLQGSTFQNVIFNDLRYYADFSITNTLYFGASTTSSYTNCMFVGFAVYEIYAP